MMGQDRWQEMIEQRDPRRWYARRGSVPDEWNLLPGRVLVLPVEPMPWSLVFHDFWTQVGVAALCRLNNYISAWYDA